MQARFTASELGFSLFDPLCSSEILPKTVEAKSVKRFAGGEHLWIGFSGCAELLWHAGHIFENGRFQNLHSGKHQLANGRQGRTRRVGSQEPANLRVRVDVDRTVLVGIRIGA